MYPVLGHSAHSDGMMDNLKEAVDNNNVRNEKDILKIKQQLKDIQKRMKMLEDTLLGLDIGE